MYNYDYKLYISGGVESDPSLWVVRSGKVCCSALQESNTLTPCHSPVWIQDPSGGRGCSAHCSHQRTLAIYLQIMCSWSAFNCVRWDQMLILVGELAPEGLPSVHSASSASSSSLQSTDGVKQGDPPFTVVLSCYPSPNKTAHFWVRGFLSGQWYGQWQGWGEE